LHGLRLRDAHPDDDVAIAMRDTATYRALAASIRTSLATACVAVLLVNQSGDITGTEPQDGLPL
jgi:hypothetical protein